MIDAPTGAEIVTVDVGFPPAGAADVSWSPDSRQVAYWSTGDASNEVRVLDLATGETTTPAGNPAADRFPAWDPSGHRLAFWSDRSGRGELWLVGSDDAEPVAIAEVGVADSPPAWSPDGSLIAATVQFGPNRWMTELMTPEAGSCWPATEPPLGRTELVPVGRPARGGAAAGRGSGHPARRHGRI